MANTIINRFSKLATDPLRNFRFYAEFTQAGEVPFDKRILSTSGNAPTHSGYSTGWVGGFTLINGLNITTSPISYREGGYNTTVHQVPGMTTFQPVTFQRGVLFGNDQAITWMRGLFASAAGDGLAAGGTANPSAGKSFRVDVTIYVADHPNAAATPGSAADDNLPRIAFKLHNAWITNLSYTDLNAGDGGLLFETMQLVHEGMAVFMTDASGKPISAPGETRKA